MEVFYIASKNNNLLINEQIKASHVLVIGPNGEQVGVKSIKDALTLASYAGLDLVLMNGNANPAVCKVMDYNKYRYEKNKKEKEALKKQKANHSETKEFRLSSVIDVGDFETKVKQVTKYLLKGDKIKVTIIIYIIRGFGPYSQSKELEKTHKKIKNQNKETEFILNYF